MPQATAPLKLMVVGFDLFSLPMNDISDLELRPKITKIKRLLDGVFIYHYLPPTSLNILPTNNHFHP